MIYDSNGRSRLSVREVERRAKLSLARSQQRREAPNVQRRNALRLVAAVLLIASGVIAAPALLGTWSGAVAAVLVIAAIALVAG